MNDPFFGIGGQPEGGEPALSAISLVLRGWDTLKQRWLNRHGRRAQAKSRSSTGDYQKTKKKNLRAQAGVLPFKQIDGDVYILLVTTRNLRRWTAPKGNVDRLRSPIDVARDEAREEGGIEGRLMERPFGKYQYSQKKRRRDVTLYLMEVTREYTEWEEDGIRRRKWWTLTDAIYIVESEGLRKLLLEFRAKVDHLVFEGSSVPTIGVLTSSRGTDDGGNSGQSGPPLVLGDLGLDNRISNSPERQPEIVSTIG